MPASSFRPRKRHSISAAILAPPRSKMACILDQGAAVRPYSGLLRTRKEAGERVDDSGREAMDSPSYRPTAKNL